MSIKYRDTHGEYSHHFHSKQVLHGINQVKVLARGQDRGRAQEYMHKQKLIQVVGPPVSMAMHCTLQGDYTATDSLTVLVR